MNKLLIISGPTASGKTSLAFDLAKKFNGEVVSADSRQVYKGMDIVTGKEVVKDVKTWLLDVVDPDQPFTVAHYYQLAWVAINDIRKRGKLPIVVGGTGFYIKAIIDGIGTMGIKPDWKLRQELGGLSVDELSKQLQKLEPTRWESMNQSDRKNPRRLVRAIEVAGFRTDPRGVVSQHPRGVRQDSSRGFIPRDSPGVELLWIGLTADYKTLYKRVDDRVDERLAIGSVEETKKLAKKYGWDILSMTGQGYRELRGFVEGNIPLEEAVKRWKFAEHEYARKQMTWFRKEKRIVWFEITEKSFKHKVEKRVQEWYH